MRWLFGRKSAAPDARAFVPAWLTAFESEGFARSYDLQFEEVYRRNPVGQRSVRLVAGMLGGLTIDGDERAVELVQADGLLESIAANLLLHGNAYAQLITSDDDQPAEICLLRPERVSVVADERGWPTAYLYRVAGRMMRFERMDALGRRQVTHLKSLHPRDDHYGMGCGRLRLSTCRQRLRVTVVCRRPGSAGAGSAGCGRKARNCRSERARKSIG